jgi:hypothetical protein
MKPIHSSWLVNALCLTAQFGSALQLDVSSPGKIVTTF